MSQRGNPIQLSYVGKIHGAPKKTKVLHPNDIFPIVQASLSRHIFRAVNVIWQQIRGAGIGSHISLSLSNLAVTIVEGSWTQAFKEVLDPLTFPFLAIRYVDNRFFFREEKAQEPSLQVLSRADFYQHPVELEEITTNEPLVFLVDSNNRQMTYKVSQPCQIRDFASARSLRLRLSGLQSRCHLISRYSCPNTESPSLIHSLVLLNGAKGFSIPDCYRVILNPKRTRSTARVPLCVSQTLFQTDVTSYWIWRFVKPIVQQGDRKPIELCPTKLSMVSPGFHGWSPWRTCIEKTVDKLLHCVVSQHYHQTKIPLPYHPFFDVSQFHFRIISTLECAKFTFGFVPLLLLTEYKLSHLLFPSLKIHG